VVEDRLEWIGFEVERAEGKPKRSLETQVFRKVRFADLADEGRSRLLRERPQLLPQSERLEGLPPLTKKRRRPGRYGEDHYAAVAALYVDAWRRNENPTQAVAKRFGVSHSAASKWVRRARDLRMISRTTPGKASGGIEHARGESAGTSSASGHATPTRKRKSRNT
jgi:hypothetical protein